MPQFSEKAGLLYQEVRTRIEQVPLTARIVLGLFLVAALFLALHSAITSKDAELHLKVQHSFRDAQLSVWVDGEPAFSGKIVGSTRKKFGLIPTDSVQGSFSQIIAVRSGQHNVRVRIEPADATAQEDSISGDIAPNTGRDLFVSARRSSLALSWQGTGGTPSEASSSFAWLARYAGSLFLTLAGSIMSALAGYAIRELPARLRTPSALPQKAEVGPE